MRRLPTQGDNFTDVVIRYVGNVPMNTSSGRKLLQSSGIAVYYNIEQARVGL